MMLFPIAISKFVGTISLGLLTGISYSTSTISLPSLALLPTAASASATLARIQTRTTRRALTFATISSLSLITCFSIAPARGKHPYLLWTALMAFIGGQGVEYYYNGLDRFPKWKSANSSSVETNHGASGNGSKSYVLVEGEEGEDSANKVNGEKVEMDIKREKRSQAVRAVISGVGFLMGVVGIWGDGA